MIEGRATARYVRTSAQKAGLVMDLIRGQNVDLALSTLRFARKRIARDIEKVLRSAVANAQQKEGASGDVDRMFVSSCYADQGPGASWLFLSGMVPDVPPVWLAELCQSLAQRVRFTDSKRPAMRTISRRVVLPAQAGHAVAAGTAWAQSPATSPKALAPDAITHNWGSFLGPTHNAVSTETRLSRELPPPLVGELEKGTGYTSPAIVGDHLLFFHRVDDQEVVENRHASTGEIRWQFRYASAYRDRYGYNNGPRSSPVISDERVYTMGAEGR